MLQLKDIFSLKPEFHKAAIQFKLFIKKILESASEPTEPPALSPALGPPGRDDYNQDMPVDDVNGQPIPEYEFNQYVSW